MNENYVKEAKDYIKNAASLFLWETDWRNPSEKALDDLRDVYDCVRLSEIADMWSLDEDELRDFVKGGKPSENIDIQALADYAKENLAFEPLDIEEKTIVSMPVTLGGPDFRIDFEVDREGDLLCARAVYRNWGERHEELLPQKVAEDMWERYSHLGDEIAERNRERPGLAQG